jgi:hypothetical protein
MNEERTDIAKGAPKQSERVGPADTTSPTSRASKPKRALAVVVGVAMLVVGLFVLGVGVIVGTEELCSDRAALGTCIDASKGTQTATLVLAVPSTALALLVLPMSIRYARGRRGAKGFVVPAIAALALGVVAVLTLELDLL